MQYGTVAAHEEPYDVNVQTVYLRAAIMAAWVLAVGTVGVAFGVTSVAKWAGLAVISAILPAIMLRLWHAPVSSMSETIRDVLR